MRKVFLGVTLIFFAFLALWFSRPSALHKDHPNEQEESQDEGIPSPPAILKDQVSEKTKASETSTEKTPFNPSHLPPLPVSPKLEDYREAVKQDPHSTPKIIIDFAVAMGARYEEAKNTKEGSLLFLKDLKDCLQSDLPLPSKAFCYRLSKRFLNSRPELKDEVERLEDFTDERVRALGRD